MEERQRGVGHVAAHGSVPDAAGSREARSVAVRTRSKINAAMGTHEMRLVARNPCSGATRVSGRIWPCCSSCGTYAARLPHEKGSRARCASGQELEPLAGADQGSQLAALSGDISGSSSVAIPPAGQRQRRKPPAEVRLDDDQVTADPTTETPVIAFRGGRDAGPTGSPTLRIRLLAWSGWAGSATPS